MQNTYVYHNGHVIPLEDYLEEIRNYSQELYPSGVMPLQSVKGNLYDTRVLGVFSWCQSITPNK